MAESGDAASTAGRPEVSVRVPGLLARFTGGRRTVRVRAGTVAESVDRLLEAHPALEPHLHDGRGRLRPHVRLLHDGTDVTALAGRDVALGEGDEVVVLQAVSGG